MKKQWIIICALTVSALGLAFVVRASRPRDSSATTALAHLLETGETAERSEDIPGAGASYRKATE